MVTQCRVYAQRKQSFLITRTRESCNRMLIFNEKFQTSKTNIKSCVKLPTSEFMPSYWQAYMCIYFACDFHNDSSTRKTTFLIKPNKYDRRKHNKNKKTSGDNFLSKKSEENLKLNINFGSKSIGLIFISSPALSLRIHRIWIEIPGCMSAQNDSVVDSQYWCLRTYLRTNLPSIVR